jgi:hypothetical protein
VFSAAVTSLNSKNGATYKLRYKKTSEAESAWKTVTLSAHTGKYTVTNAEYIFAASGSSSYNVEVTATDNHYSGGKSTTASTAFTLAHYGKNGDSISFGMVDDESGVMSNGLNLKQQGNRFSFSSVGTAETDGFILMARITITASNADSPITFVFSRRKAKSPMTVHVAFKSSSNTTPELESIRYEGENYGAYIVQSSSSVWDLYVQKVSQSDTVTLNDWFTSYRQMKRVSVTFVGSIASAVPNPYYRATPLVVQSILDCFMPVGFIIMLYSHADPNTMYPGTTWVRIYGAFPWFTDGNGQIGLTGGERTVTLTEKQIPAHSHGSVYSQHAAGTKDKAWYTTSGTSVAYGAVSTGGGEAHNNMPPYIQLSAWRRTA